MRHVYLSKETQSRSLWQLVMGNRIVYKNACFDFLQELRKIEFKFSNVPVCFCFLRSSLFVDNFCEIIDFPQKTIYLKTRLYVYEHLTNKLFLSDCFVSFCIFAPNFQDIIWNAYENQVNIGGWE